MTKSESTILLHFLYEQSGQFYPAECTVLVSKVNGWYKQPFGPTVVLMSGGEHLPVAESLEEMEKLWDGLHSPLPNSVGGGEVADMIRRGLDEARPWLVRAGIYPR
jgi:hypothetical protein